MPTNTGPACKMHGTKLKPILTSSDNFVSSICNNLKCVSFIVIVCFGEIGKIVVGRNFYNLILAEIVQKRLISFLFIFFLAGFDLLSPI
ncbi:unnamed protein product [Brassica napus]|uniref:(rape) hypothetical protein n=1 Tax=Brassica napus TaxID=3708 RepID=A0A816LC04_BRANA|nr:unnamed protein product [Brassica napus]